MDTSYEDKMYRQVENSLLNNINDKLFVPIEIIDKPVYNRKNNNKIEDSAFFKEQVTKNEPNLTFDSNYENGDAIYNTDGEYKEVEPRLSRAEYILQAREACLRQMNTLNTTSRMSDVYVDDRSPIISTYKNKKKNKAEGLFSLGNEKEDNPEEITSFRSLIIRTICAVVIFLSIFIIDKVKLNWGAFSYETLEKYVISNNQLKALEEIIVSWLK